MPAVQSPHGVDQEAGQAQTLDQAGMVYDARGVPHGSTDSQAQALLQQEQAQEQAQVQERQAAALQPSPFAPYTAAPSDAGGATASPSLQAGTPTFTAGGIMGTASAGASAGAGNDDYYAIGGDESNEAKRRRIARVRIADRPPMQNDTECFGDPG
ncbi:hypothetical protein KEM52_000055 [Ascosphaera acerosa]|nr:hypothetical protein KEM52_000055 [Ascosphaera acerosa]